MKFTKMHGCGNDYVYVDGGKENVPSEKKSKVAQMVSDRHFGIGSDDRSDSLFLILTEYWITAIAR